MTNFSSNIVAKNDDKSYLFLFFTFHFGIYDTNLCSKSGFPAFFGIKCPFFHQTFTQKSHFRPPYLRPKNSEKITSLNETSQKKKAEILRIFIPALLEYSGVLTTLTLYS